jgi:hypothetical protein
MSEDEDQTDEGSSGVELAQFWSAVAVSLCILGAVVSCMFGGPRP